MREADEPTTLVVPNVNKIRGLNLLGTPWACSGLLRDDLYLYQSICQPTKGSRCKSVAQNGDEAMTITFPVLDI
jgi:hypothetical protein